MEGEAKREYQRVWVEKRRQKCFDYLGGVCRSCGSVEDLEFDHVDRANKSFAIGRNYNRSWSVLALELDKCQLLCQLCHRTKSSTSGDFGGGQNKADECPHGTLWGYTSPHWRCRCLACKKAKADSRRKIVV